MSLRDYLVGSAFLVATLGSLLGGAALVVRGRLRHLTGVVRVLGFSVLATLNLVLAHLVPGALGILTRGSVLACALLVALACAALGRARVTASERREPTSMRTGRVSWLIAALAMAIALIAVIALAAHEGRSPVSNGDALTFHLTQTARWIQTGSLWGINDFSPDWTWGTEPNTGVLLQLVFVLPWRGDAFVRLPNYAFLALSALAVYAISRELGAPRGASCTVAAIFVAMPTTMLTALDFNLPDTVMLANFGAGVLFLLRHVRTRLRSDLALGGIALGLSFGTKWYAVLTVTAVALVWLAAWLLSRHSLRDVGRWVVILGALIASVGGYWLLRNWVATGDPMFPARVAPLGLTVFDAPTDPYRQHFGFSIAHYIGRAEVWQHWILPGFKRAFGYSAVLVCAGLAISLAVAGRLRRRGPDGHTEVARIVAVALAALAIVVTYVVSPFTAAGKEGQPYLVVVSTRFALPALLLACALSAWAVGRLRRWAWVLETIGAVLIAYTVARGYPKLMSHPFTVFSVKYVAIGITFVAAVAAGCLLLRSGRVPVLGGRRGGVLAGMVAALVLALSLATGYAHQRSYFAHRYRGLDPTFDWVLDHAPGGRRIALAGASGPSADYAAPWPMHGPRLGNYVAYVGPRVRGKLDRYRSQRRFISGLRSGHYDLVLIGRFVATRSVPEEQWARAAGWLPVAFSGRYSLMRSPSFAPSRVEGPA